MKKVIYTILSILAICYIALLAVDVVMKETAWGLSVNLGKFEKAWEFVVRFGGIAIIFCFALVNFAGSPLKTVFFILLIVAIIAYVIVLCTPDFFYNLFNPKPEGAADAVNFVNLVTRI